MQRIVVISDLHLGGAPAKDGEPDFRICSPASQELLAEFVTWVTAGQSASCPVHLVLAGDIVDFLAEKDFSPFTPDDRVAADKLAAIMDRTTPIWTNLARFAASGGRLTLLLGNHDIELSLPRPRRLLMETLGPGRVEFIYDNQALVAGPVLIEHGNRYDGWNVVPHDKLREVRSALSRGETPIDFSVLPGSRMVVDVINPLKKTYAFVDLLKPENAGVVPLIAVLDPASWKSISKIVALARRQQQNRFDQQGLPVDPGNINARDDAEDALIALARTLALGDTGNISAGETPGSFLEGIRKAAGEQARRFQIDLLYQAFRALAKEHAAAFDVNHEDKVYLEPAKATAARGFRVVVYGHTHLVKRVKLDAAGAVYLNTGTWADLMKVPQGIQTGNEAQAKKDLGEFAVALLGNDIGRWRRALPTFAQIEVDGDVVRSADVYHFDGANRIERVADGCLTRLAY